MIFGPTPLAEAEGAILAHSLSAGALRFKKGRVLSGQDVAALRAAGIETVVAARLEAGDVHEDAAAAAIAEAIMGPGLSATAAFTGRANLIAETRGLLVLDRERLGALNLVDEAVTVATLSPYDLVEPRQITATVKIIPFAVPGKTLERCLEVARDGAGSLIRVAALRSRKVGLIQTSLPGMKKSLLGKTKRALDARLAALDCPPAEELRCGHDEAAVAQAIGSLRARDCAIVLISGASAIVDRRDVIPAGIVRAGGAIDHFGMPVDPGNLILLGHAADTPVLGLPGCARSPKLNGFDWVLQRLIADLPAGPRDVMLMGAGGLLKEIPVRPLPRAEAVEEAVSKLPRAPRIAALVLAGGQSRRTGPANKLLSEVAGKPMIAQVVGQVLASRAEPVLVVTGHEREKIEAALSGLAASTVYNPNFAAGLSTSLHRGLAGLPADIDGVMVCLGDMPGVTAAVIDKLITAFNPLEGRAICVPTWQGKRGNPVLFARRFLPEMQSIGGDNGARQLIGDYPDVVSEVAMEDRASGDGILLDVDTPEALATLKSTG
ncbi:MAG: NTP transferase domain-containing protein [Kiloniellaceae bacterium]